MSPGVSQPPYSVSFTSLTNPLPPITSFTCPGQSSAPGLLPPSHPTPMKSRIRAAVAASSGQLPGFMPASQLSPFMFSADVPLVGFGPVPSPFCCLMPLLVIFQEGRMLPSGCTSHPLFLSAQGVRGTNALLPTGLSVVLPSMGPFVGPSFPTGQGPLMCPSSSPTWAPLMPTIASPPGWSINSKSGEEIVAGPSLANGLASSEVRPPPVPLVGTGTHAMPCPDCQTQPGDPSATAPPLVLPMGPGVTTLPPPLRRTEEDLFPPVTPPSSPVIPREPWMFSSPSPKSRITGFQMLVEASEQNLARRYNMGRMPKFQVDQYLVDLSDSDLSELVGDCLDRPLTCPLDMDQPWEDVRFQVFCLGEKIRRLSAVEAQRREVREARRLAKQMEDEEELRLEAESSLSSWSTEESDRELSPSPPERKRLRRQGAKADVTK